MICTTIQNRNLDDILGLLEDDRIQMAEIRLDRCTLEEDDIRTLFSSSDTPLVATCRISGDGKGTWKDAETKLLAAIEAGAAAVDVEIQAPAPMGKKIRRACTEYGTVMIRSCHFFDGTPSLETLVQTAQRCSRFGGEIVKVATMAASKEEAETVLSLYDCSIPGRLIAFAMGDAGRESRLMCLAKGAPFTYSALSEEEAAAPGQWSLEEMVGKLYSGRIFPKNSEPLFMPSSKSFAQRAIIAAALSGGESVLKGYSPCGDSEASIRVAEAIGAKVQREEGNILRINGISASEGAFSTSTLNVGESGLLTRLMIPVAAAAGSGKTVIEGEGTLLRRPLKGAADIMASFGTIIRPLGNPVKEGIFVPLSVQGPLLPGKAEISGKDGSQLISGLLMALPLLGKDSSLYVSEPKSIPYMFITMDVLRKFGIRIGSEMEGDEDFMELGDWNLCTGISFKIKGAQEYSPAQFAIEGDWSAAANFMVAGAVFGKVELEGLDTTSLQADISIMDILMEAGASLSQIEEDDHRGTITVRRAPLRAFEADMGNCPDLFPIVSILAAFCPGESRLGGFKRLAGKESDRGKAIVDMLTKMGVPAAVQGDILTVNGETLESRILNHRLLKGGKYSSSHDHRMVMALKVAQEGADSTIEIDDEECVAKSFPDFHRTFGKLKN